MRKLRTAQLTLWLFLLFSLFFFSGKLIGQGPFCCCLNVNFSCNQNAFYPGSDCDAWCPLVGATNAGDAAGYPTISCTGSPCEAPLPIELTFFRARLLENARVATTWETASELNNEGFEVQRASGLSMTWELLDFVPGAGTTLEPRDYSYLDKAPPPGTNYYRLRQLDFDGTASFSNIEVVNLRESAGVAVWPTLAKDYLSVRFEDGLPDAAYLLEVYDTMGRKVMEQSEPSGLIDISALRQGHYFMQFSIGNNSHSARFVKYR